jgi:DNA-binding transcriptional LysR family regulator
MLPGYMMNLRNFDLNLLLVFDAVLRERSVLRAAEALSLSQPAVSHALNRLRYLLKDKLFVRTALGMVPTPRAEQLALPIRKALNDIQLAFEGETFVPATAERRFVLAANNYAAVVAAGPVVAACRAQAPGVRLVIRPSGTLDLVDLLDRGELDLVISTRDAPAERFSSLELLEDRYVAVLRKGHPALRRKLTLSALSALKHLAISSSGEDLSFIDAALAQAKKSRSIALEVPYLSAGAILVQSNLVALLGRKLAQEFRRSFPIEIRDLPFDASKLRSVLLWHRRFDDAPAHRWLRETIRTTMAAI